MKRRYLTILMVLLLSLCLAACGSTSEGISRTQALFSKYSKETGVHLGLSMENDGMDTLVELYQLGDNLSLDVTVGEDRFVYIVKDNTLTVLDPANQVSEQMEITDEVQGFLETISSGVDNILSLGQADVEYQKGTVTIDGMKYETEEAVNEGSTVKFAYRDDGALAYIITLDGATETEIRITAFDGDVEESRFDIPDGYEK